jgi:peptidoglycan/xylan/chitin deacetylase (PgdA/CDA1 family)
MPQSNTIKHRASQLLHGCGVTAIARLFGKGQASILRFHGLRSDDDQGWLAPGMHIPESDFRQVCQRLAEDYKVLSLAEIAHCQQKGLVLPARAVGLSFDDGFGSNYKKAFPILREYGLPATVFTVTGWLDGLEQPWFLRLETLLHRSTVQSIKGGSLMIETPAQKLAAYNELTALCKVLPQEQLPERLSQWELEAGVSVNEPIPESFHPLTWAKAREMQSSGLIEFGGHTHRHWIMSRCSPETQVAQANECWQRLQDELGTRPGLFAYPNGKHHDYNSDSIRALRLAGFKAAFTTSSGSVGRNQAPFCLPRMTAPVSVAHAEVLASGLVVGLEALVKLTKPLQWFPNKLQHSPCQ